MTPLRFSGVKMSIAKFLVTGILDKIAREEWGKLRFACSPAVALLALPIPRFSCPVSPFQGSMMRGIPLPRAMP